MVCTTNDVQCIIICMLKCDEVFEACKLPGEPRDQVDYGLRPAHSKLPTVVVQSCIREERDRAVAEAQEWIQQGQGVVRKVIQFCWDEEDNGISCTAEIYGPDDSEPDTLKHLDSMVCRRRYPLAYPSPLRLFIADLGFLDMSRKSCLPMALRTLYKGSTCRWQIFSARMKWALMETNATCSRWNASGSVRIDSLKMRNNSKKKNGWKRTVCACSPLHHLPGFFLILVCLHHLVLASQTSEDQ